MSNSQEILTFKKAGISWWAYIDVCFALSVGRDDTSVFLYSLGWTVCHLSMSLLLLLNPYLSTSFNSSHLFLQGPVHISTLCDDALSLRPCSHFTNHVIDSWYGFTWSMTSYSDPPIFTNGCCLTPDKWCLSVIGYFSITALGDSLKVNNPAGTGTGSLKQERGNK